MYFVLNIADLIGLAMVPIVIIGAFIYFKIMAKK
jgi:uncharacterized protein YneF (UPF0154 family)